jgi:hypothetical protein
VKGTTAVTLLPTFRLRAAQTELDTPVRAAAPFFFTPLTQAGVATGAAQ